MHVCGIVIGAEPFGRVIADDPYPERISVLADRQGLVLFDGLLVPTLKLAAWRRWHAKDHVAQAADFPAAIGPHPGKIVAIDCEGEPSRHVCDARFLAFWMTHEAFHFVN